MMNDNATNTTAQTPSLRKNVVLYTLYQVLTVLTPLVTAWYVSRVLGAEKVGIYSYTGAEQMYFAMFASLGTGIYGAREIARHRNDRATYSKLFWEIELLTVITTTIMLMAWGAWIYFHPEERLYYMILSICVLAVLFDISWFYTGLEQFKYTVAQNSIFKILCVAAVFIWVKSEEDLPVYMLIMSLSSILSHISMWMYLPKFLVPVKGRLQIFAHFPKTFVYFIPNVATSVYTVLDKSLINQITQSNLENGYYEQATKIMNMMKTVTFAAVNSVVGSRMAYLFEQGEDEEIRNKLQTSLHYILFMGVGICFGLLGVANRFVPFFFGPGYDAVVPILYILSPLILIVGISNCLNTQYYIPSGRQKASACLIIVGAVVNVLLNLVLIRFIGARGAAVSSVIAELLILVLMMILCRGYMTFVQVVKTVWKKLLAGVVMLSVLIGIGFLPIHFYAVLALQIVIGALLYMGLLLWWKDDFLCGLVEDLKNRFLRGRKA